MNSDPPVNPFASPTESDPPPENRRRRLMPPMWEVIIFIHLLVGIPATLIELEIGRISGSPGDARFHFSISALVCLPLVISGVGVWRGRAWGWWLCGMLYMVPVELIVAQACPLLLLGSLLVEAFALLLVVAAAFVWLTWSAYRNDSLQYFGIAGLRLPISFITQALVSLAIAAWIVATAIM